MNQGSTRRIVASALLAAMATTLAACGIAGGPVAMTGAAGTSTFANRAPAVEARRFGLTFDAKTPKVKNLPGTSRGNTPAIADLRAKLSPVDDQGRIGACTGFAMAGLAEYRARQTGNTAELSPGFVYLMELKEDGHLGKDGGSRISTGMRVLQKYGISTEALHPY
ncbi:MAG: hypothetical protein H7338_18155, partial [Candidatus Sericytochromatia bacterium]|nr:hypothetical protein [Candidatus Sericytochromatia bacterium]